MQHRDQPWRHWSTYYVIFHLKEHWPLIRLWFKAQAKSQKVFTVTTMKLRLQSFLVCIGKKWLAHYVTSFAPYLITVIHYALSTVKTVITEYNFVFSSIILCRQGWIIHLPLVIKVWYGTYLSGCPSRVKSFVANLFTFSSNKDCNVFFCNRNLLKFLCAWYWM